VDELPIGAARSVGHTPAQSPLGILRPSVLIPGRTPGIGEAQFQLGYDLARSKRAASNLAVGGCSPVGIHFPSTHS